MLTAQVIKSMGSIYEVETPDSEKINCTIKGKFRIEGHKTTNPVAVGDLVDIDIFESAGIKTGVILKIHDRKNYIIRKASKLSKQYQIVATNIDQAFLVVTVEFPRTPPEFIDRFLMTCEAYKIPALLVFNKADLYDASQKEFMNNLIEIYSKIGYSCFQTNAHKRKSLEPLFTLLPNKISLFSGNSGVGKSTIINQIDPSLQRKVEEISNYHKSGKHTTTFSEMFPLKNGGYIIDTPGIKSFGLIDFGKEELYHYFPEIFKASAECMYHNCVHVEEPKCAVKEAVQAGLISELRYRNYLSIYFDEDSKYR